MQMSKGTLLACCKESKLYRTPSLNDKLYLNFKGFVDIGNLEEYVGLRALFLEGNAISSLEGLPPLKELRCLYVQNNDLAEVSGLEEISALDTLNISNNRIACLSNLACCPLLRTLICTSNKLDSVESIQHLAECKGLQTLDLQNNDIADPAALEVFKQIPELKCLYLKGNPLVSNMKNYRKTMVASMPCLTYLDERPVFEDERRLTMAWMRGGVDAEREERKLIREEDESKKRANFEAMQQLRREGWRKRRERLGLPPGDTDPMLDEFSDEEYVIVEEPEELRKAREKLAAYSARVGEEEPQELAEARQSRVSAGQPVSCGKWQASPKEGGGADAEDCRAYLADVARNQAELNTQGAWHSTPAPGGSERGQQQGQGQGQPQRGSEAGVGGPAEQLGGGAAGGAPGEGDAELDPALPKLEYVGDVELNELD